MARCIVSAYLDHVYVEQLDAEAVKRGITRTALVRELIMQAFPSVIPTSGVRSDIVKKKAKQEDREEKKAKLRELAASQGWQEGERRGLFCKGDEEITETELESLLGDLL